MIEVVNYILIIKYLMKTDKAKVPLIPTSKPSPAVMSLDRPAHPFSMHLYVAIPREVSFGG